jgi:signal transduction histidine kinase
MLAAVSTRGDEAPGRRLLQIGPELMSELESEAVLERVLDEARELTGARYAALGVLDETRHGLQRFVTSGIAAERRRAIGDPPRGRGVLGLLIDEPRPLRVSDIGEHPQSFGFPPGHPPMHSFLGVPILLRGQVWGNLYLTEKHGGGPFTPADEDTAVMLAGWAATAIENARLYERSEHRRDELERTVRALEASRDITNAIGGAVELDQVLELIVKRGRALVEARSVLILLREGDELVVAASAGQAVNAPGHRLPIDGSTSGQVLLLGEAMRIDDATRTMLVSPAALGVPEAQTALLVPMRQRGRPVGVLAAFDRGPRNEPFTREEEELLRDFATAAANAVVIKRSVEAERLRSAIAAADAERRRWARELHDQTLQSLGALRVLLASAERRGDPAHLQNAVRQAIADIELEIDNLRGIISDLRPSLLDDIGLRPAVQALLERRRGRGLIIDATLSLPDPDRQSSGLSAELETTIYRLVQEALTNVVKHAQATQVAVNVTLSETAVSVEIRDDGRGFDPAARTNGFGLSGMRERVYLAGGSLEMTSDAKGTRVRARVPVHSTDP